MAFLQTAPVLSNQYLDDRVLRSYLRRVLPPAVLGAIESDLTELGEFAATRTFKGHGGDKKAADAKKGK